MNHAKFILYLIAVSGFILCSHATKTSGRDYSVNEKVSYFVPIGMKWHWGKVTQVQPTLQIKCHDGFIYQYATERLNISETFSALDTNGVFFYIKKIHTDSKIAQEEEEKTQNSTNLIEKQSFSTFEEVKKDHSEIKAENIIAKEEENIIAKEVENIIAKEKENTNKPANILDEKSFSADDIIAKDKENAQKPASVLDEQSFSAFEEVKKDSSEIKARNIIAKEVENIIEKVEENIIEKEEANTKKPANIFDKETFKYGWKGKKHYPNIEIVQKNVPKKEINQILKTNDKKYQTVKNVKLSRENLNETKNCDKDEPKRIENNYDSKTNITQKTINQPNDLLPISPKVLIKSEPKTKNIQPSCSDNVNFANKNEGKVAEGLVRHFQATKKKEFYKNEDKTTEDSNSEANLSMTNGNKIVKQNANLSKNMNVPKIKSKSILNKSKGYVPPNLPNQPPQRYSSMSQKLNFILAFFSWSWLTKVISTSRLTIKKKFQSLYPQSGTWRTFIVLFQMFWVFILVPNELQCIKIPTVFKFIVSSIFPLISENFLLKHESTFFTKMFEFMIAVPFRTFNRKFFDFMITLPKSYFYFKQTAFNEDEDWEFDFYIFSMINESIILSIFELMIYGWHLFEGVLYSSFMNIFLYNGIISVYFLIRRTRELSIKSFVLLTYIFSFLFYLIRIFSSFGLFEEVTFSIISGFLIVVLKKLWPCYVNKYTISQLKNLECDTTIPYLIFWVASIKIYLLTFAISKISGLHFVTTFLAAFLIISTLYKYAFPLPNKLLLSVVRNSTKKLI